MQLPRAAGLLGSSKARAKDISDGRQAISGLVDWVVLHMRGERQVRGLLSKMPAKRVRVVASSKGLTKWRRLNYTFIGKALMRWRDDTQACRGLVATGHAWRFSCELIGAAILGTVHGFTLARLLLKSCLDDATLLFANVEALLEMLLHDRILCHETG